MNKRPIIGMAILLAVGSLHADPTFNYSDFSAGMDGWQPDNPWTTSTDNGIGPGNPYLAMDVGALIGNRGSKMITFNSEVDWTGNYFDAGVTGVELDVANWSSTDTVFLRVTVGNRANPQQSGGTWWLSDTAVALAPGTEWTHVSLSLLEEDLVTVGNLMGELGTDSYQATFSDVQTIRLLSASLPLGAIGDDFVGLVGFDNIILVPEPSSIIMIFLGITVAGGSMLIRRRNATLR